MTGTSFRYAGQRQPLLNMTSKQRPERSLYVYHRDMWNYVYMNRTHSSNILLAHKKIYIKYEIVFSM